MPEDIDAFIEPIVEAARIPSRRRRDELRRELRSHFEDSGLTLDAFQDAVGRFGNAAHIGNSLRQVYRRDYVLVYALKVGASILAATTAAILIEALASLRPGTGPDAWGLSPGFAHAAAFGVVVALALVAATEATRPPFTWPRALVSTACYALLPAGAFALDSNIAGVFVTASILAAIGVGFAKTTSGWTSRALLTLAAFAVFEYVLHQSLGIAFSPMRALAAGAVLLVLWASTITIVAVSDRAFFNAFSTT
jgi:hypothetical protein